jgi:hypothetical protein
MYIYIYIYIYIYVCIYILVIVGNSRHKHKHRSNISLIGGAQVHSQFHLAPLRLGVGMSAQKTFPKQLIEGI